MKSCAITEMAFEITRIKTERTPNGKSVIMFKPLDGNPNEFYISIYNKHLGCNKYIRNKMEECYADYSSESVDNTIKVGDII